MLALTLVITLVGIDPNAGTTGFDFLKLTPTAREAAMGGAAVASTPGPMGFWFSPAHALSAEGPRANVGYLNYVAGIQTGSAAYSQPVDTDKGVGFGIVYLNSGTMKRTNERGEELGTFGVSYANLNLSGAMRLGDELSVGIALQGLYGSIDTFFGLVPESEPDVNRQRVAAGLEGLELVADVLHGQARSEAIDRQSIGRADVAGKAQPEEGVD
jgi:long-subunit fatty acid transport protein